VTFEEFINDLKTTRLNWKWEVTHFGAIRGYRAPCVEVCPIIAVALGRGVQIHADPGFAFEAAVALGLEDDLTADIVSEADSYGPIDLRWEMLGALGLEERVPQEAL
jgi:hypothetical protein